ncbi:MAG: ABC transporter ATP-binding protein [bacterium]|nr:ABC transporter ATP-binding protein [bacterium]
MYRLKGEGLSKRFGGLKVFSKLSFDLRTGDSMAVVGPNGSGKSTLMMVLLSIYRPTRGKISYLRDENSMEEAQIRSSVSLVSPYLNLYDQLSGEENLKFFATVAGESVTGKEIERLLEKVGLAGRGMDLVGGYSSGMKQRLKYATALLNKPAFLFLDEPTSNLDAAGKKIVSEVIEEYRSQAIIVIATNEQEEYSLATKQLRVDQ